MSRGTSPHPVRSWFGLWVALLLCAAAPAAAQSSGGDYTWRFGLTPYLWMASLEGDVATLSGLPKADVDADFSDILDHTDFSLMVAGELAYGPIGFLGDITYLELSADGTTPGQAFTGVELDTETLILTLAGFYRVLERDRGSLDLVGGMRIWDIDTTLEFDPGLLAGRRQRDDQSWADPIVGARGRFPLMGPLFLTAVGDVGGFGTASDFTWEAMGTLDYQPVDWLSIRAGYRHIDVDFDDGDFVWDVALSGPILGASLRF